MSEPFLASLSAQFTAFDWLIVAAYLLVTTLIGTLMAGKQATIRDYFLGGRKLPWYAVSASIIATEISAVTFVIVPFLVFRPGGNMEYLQLGIFGSFFARIIVGYVLVPAYYKREIYSPYDYMGNQLGSPVRGMTTALFILGGMLAQGARVYLTAEILLVVLGDQLQVVADATHLAPLAVAVICITIVAVVWTLIGGIATVIWTDAILFLVFLAGSIVALVTATLALQGDFGELLRIGWAAKDSGPWGKFTFFNFDPSPARPFTIWTAVIASTWGGLGAYGTDQLLAQRMFCCKTQRAARWAIISSAASQFVTIAVALVGVALYAYYREAPSAAEIAAAPEALAHPDFPRLRGEAFMKYQEKGDRIFPIFIVEAIRPGLSGLIIAAIFAAAVSSLTSILAALSQTTMAAFYQPLRQRFLAARMTLSGSAPPRVPDDRAAQPLRYARAPKFVPPPIESDAEDRRSVLVSRVFVLCWGAVLAGTAFLAQAAAKEYPSILDLALAMAGYAQGPLLAGFLLAFLPLKIDGRGFMYAGPLGVMCVFAVIWHQDWTLYACIGLAAALLLAWMLDIAQQPQHLQNLNRVLREGVLLLLGIGLMLMLQLYGQWEGTNDRGETVKLTLAWPWQVPLGSLITFIWGYLLARPKAQESETAST
ncbi:MAG: hypothetical protein IPM18_10635 [Phycisphaerales bacterium]|nr:hypothetical protein [Phycisphaerales bacterium]